MMDTTLPTPATFNTSAMISSTPAVTEEVGTSHDIGVVHDGSYIAAPSSKGMLNAGIVPSP